MHDFILERIDLIGDETWTILSGEFYSKRYDWVRRQPLSGPILDAACGQGYQSVLLAKDFPGEQVVGFDLDPDLCIYARELVKANHVDVPILQGNIYEPPFDSKFYTVCAFEVLEHLENPMKAVDALASLLLPGGAMLVSCPMKGTMQNLYGHVQDFSSHDLVSILFQAGLDVVEIQQGWPFQMLRAVK